VIRLFAIAELLMGGLWVRVRSGRASFRSSEAARSFDPDVEKSELLRTIEKACLVYNEVV
jgi:hypothetical protein